MDSATGESRTFTGRFVILATGGAGRLFSHTTNPEVATGGRVALAFQAGASVMDLEFYQIDPTALNLKGAPSFSLSEAMQGESAVLWDQQGRAFMADYNPLADLVPQDVVSRANSGQTARVRAGKVFLDISHLPPETIQARFPTIYSSRSGHHQEAGAGGPCGPLHDGRRQDGHLGSHRCSGSLPLW